MEEERGGERRSGEGKGGEGRGGERRGGESLSIDGLGTINMNEGPDGMEIMIKLGSTGLASTAVTAAGIMALY